MLMGNVRFLTHCHRVIECFSVVCVSESICILSVGVTQSSPISDFLLGCTSQEFPSVNVCCLSSVGVRYSVELARPDSLMWTVSGSVESAISVHKNGVNTLYETIVVHVVEY